MLFLFFASALYSLTIVYSFDCIPYSWLCDYDADLIIQPEKTPLSFSMYFFPVFLFTSFSLFLFFHETHTPLNTLTELLMILLLAHICLSDNLYRIIPDQHIILIFLLGILYSDSPNIWYKLEGLLSGALPFIFLLTIGVLLRNQEYIGFGDIKLLSALGFFMGGTDVFSVYILSSLLSGLFSVLLILGLTLKKERNLPLVLPLAPFISLSFIFYTGFFSLSS
ncbi:prepilin peptidase [Aminipila luticellarii]|uniref:Prepilin type IV endopeptidase peptidase domain-containing protein n=1 Tax=Aminipila luticellarii TaxID=2507160 RepID=A0A410PX75_9FIRM|nr:prepilin peptidase [Aminipila luticellarii]QAT43496.1 hypothetical protein EQM06_09860 [Aminipila luticellarii]